MSSTQNSWRRRWLGRVYNPLSLPSSLPSLYTKLFTFYQNMPGSTLCLALLALLETIFQLRPTHMFVVKLGATILHVWDSRNGGAENEGQDTHVGRRLGGRLLASVERAYKSFSALANVLLITTTFFCFLKIHHTPFYVCVLGASPNSISELQPTSIHVPKTGATTSYVRDWRLRNPESGIPSWLCGKGASWAVTGI
jgi:hypothetical protein